MTRDRCDRLRDILTRIDAAFVAEAHLAEAADATAAATAFDAILYDLIVIGEAVKALPASFKDAHPNVNWAGATGMRDILAHRYFGVRADVVRATLDAPLLALRAGCEHLLAQHCS